MFPRETCAVIIEGCWVGNACRIGWKITVSPSSILDEFLVGVSISIVLECRHVLINSSAVVQAFFLILVVIIMYP